MTLLSLLKKKSPAEDEKLFQERDRAFLKKIRFATGRKLNSTFSGEYRSAFRGTGLSFDSVREYMYGDDVRNVDWNVSARMNRLYIKEFIEERDLSILVMADVSGSMLFGKERSKREKVLETVYLLLSAAEMNRDRFSVLLFSDRPEKFIRQPAGRRPVQTVMNEIIRFRPESRATDLGKAFDFAGKVLKRRSLIFCISDFMDEKKDFLSKMKLTGRRHEIIPVQVYDPAEENLPFYGLTEFLDLESGMTFFEDAVPESAVLPALQVPGVLRLSTEDPADLALLGYFKKRKRSAGGYAGGRHS